MKQSTKKRRNYKIAKAFFIITISVTVISTIVSVVFSGFVLALMILFVMLAFSLLSGLLLYITANEVVDINYSDESAVIATNVREYVLACKNFVEVRGTINGKVLIKYKDEVLTKTFTFIVIYSPLSLFQPYKLDIGEMKKYMKNAEFVGVFE